MSLSATPFPTSAIPQTQTERIDWIRLIRSRRVGPATFQRLMREHRSAKAALNTLPDIAQGAGIKGYQICRAEFANAELDAAQRHNATMLCYGAPEYPSGLYDLPDPPAYLWAIGRVDLISCTSVALVGARNASSAGCNMARRLARELGQAGHAVVSGLARGIDRAAHEASLESGTIAVLAGGADINYPQECAALADDIRHKGLVLSEMPFGVQPQARHFPARNRIISGIAAGVVVIEGATKSGSLITARNALDQGREVMAVPGSPLDPRAGGCNALIRDGAQLVRSAADVLETLNAVPPSERTAPPEPAVPCPDKEQAMVNAKKVLGLIGTTPVSEDDIIEETGADARAAMTVISELEIEGRIERHPGGRIALVPS